jgi:multiple sugar transport system substrate-binding protein
MPMRAFSALRMLLLAAAMAAGVAGCGGGGDDDGEDKGAATGKTVTITFWHGQNQSAGKAINSLVDKFNASQDRVRVDSQIGAPSDGLLEKTTAALAGGKYPDVVYQFGPNIANLARSPKALDLTDTVKDPEWNWDDFFPAARDAVAVDGRVRAIPALIDSMAVVYSKKLFREAGIEPPKAGWTWDDYRAIARQLTDADAGRFGTGWPGVGDEDTTWRLWPMVWSAGGDVLAEGGGEVGYGGDPGLRSLELIAQMAQEDKSVYVDKTVGSEKMYQVLMNGRMGMVPTGPWQLPDIIDAKLDYGVAPMPTFGGEPVTISGPDAWMLFDNGDARSQAAIEFVRWLTQPEQDATWDVEAGSLPLRASTAEQPVWTDHVKEVEGLQTFVDALEVARVRPVIESYPKISEAVGQAVAGVLLGQQAPPAALDRAVSGGNEALQDG